MIPPPFYFIERTRMDDLISCLEGKLSSEAQVLRDPSSVAFQDSLQRWSNIDLQVPGAIIKPATELDAVTAVGAAFNLRLPFVPVCGGHSPWSTIGAHGFILDLTLYKSVEVESTTDSVRVAGAVLAKELAVKLSDAGRCTALGNGNTVGVIPYCLGGGIGTLTGLVGFGCDNILSARIITAEGKLKVVSADSDPGLFWAIKGAGQFFGVVTEITLRTYPLSICGTPEGKHWAALFLYPIGRAEEVCRAMEPLMVDTQNVAFGNLMLLTPPPLFKPVIAVAPHYLGDPKQAPAAFETLTNLGPLMFKAEIPFFPNISDHLDFACAKGDFKRFSAAGLKKFKTENFMNVVEIWLDLVQKCPDAGKTGYFVDWHSPAAKIPIPQHDSAFSHHDVYLWINCNSWYHDGRNGDMVFNAEQRVIDAMRAGQHPADYIDYPNVNRDGPLERRYRGEDRLAKLRVLKREWDPRGVFTTQLL